MNIFGLSGLGNYQEDLEDQLQTSWPLGMPSELSSFDLPENTGGMRYSTGNMPTNLLPALQVSNKTLVLQ